MSRIRRNIVINMIGQGTLLVLGFVAVRYIYRGLGEDALGIIYFGLTASTVISAMLDLGIGSSAIREVSACAATEPEYVADFVRTGSSFFWAAYLFLALAMYLSAPLIVNHWLNLKTLAPITGVRVLRIIGIASLVALPRTLYVGVLRGLQRMEFNNVIDVATSALQQFGTIAILLLGGGLFRVVYWFTFCYFASLAAYIVACSALLPRRAVLPGFSSTVIKRNFKFASHMATASILSVLESQADKVIVSKLLPIGMFGYYGVAYAAVSKGMLLTGSIADAVLPSFCELHGQGRIDTLLSQYNKLQDVLCLVTIPIFAAIPFAALPIFTLVMNAQVAHLLLSPVTFLCLGFYLNSTLYAPHLFSVSTGRPDITARFNLYALFVVPPAAILLIHFFGLKGAGLSWVVYNLFSYAYAVPRVCNECGLGITPFQWYARIFRFLGPAGTIYSVAWVISRTVGHSSVPALAVAYLLASLTFAGASFFLIGPDLRSTLQGLARAFRAKYVEAL